MTTTGKQCIFPFTYKNDTSPVLEYNVCSTLDIYKPWCPTGAFQGDQLGEPM
jgi:hypothetical protein